MKNRLIKKMMLFFTLLGTLFVSMNGHATLNESTQIISQESSIIEPTPQIDINYSGLTSLYSTVNEEITLRYQIIPQPFEVESVVKKDLDLIFLVDISPEMENGGHLATLKNSLINFIDSFTDMENSKVVFNNLSVSLISFSSRGTIQHNSSPIIINGEIQETELTDLKSSINGLKKPDYADTKLLQKNLGEGLRQTGYLLSQMNSNREKILIQMSEGALTQSTVVSSDDTKNLYLEIDNKDPGVKQGDIPYLFTNPNGNNSGQKDQADDYAVKVANLIKNKVNHVFSIMIGGSSGNSSHHRGLKGAHEALGGKDSNLYYTSDMSYETIFKDVSNELQKNYTINFKNNITLNPNISFIDDIDGIEIPSIKYEINEDGVYTPCHQVIEFTITIKATKEGSFKIFDNNELSYKNVYGQDIIIEIDNPIVTVSLSELKPIIETELSVNRDYGPNGQEIDVTYTIIPKEFKENFSFNENDRNIAVLIDTSSANNLSGYIQNALENRILNDFYNNQNGAYLNMSFISYNKDVLSYQTDHSLNNPRDKLQTDLKKISSTSNSDRNLNLALEKAKDFFNESTNKQASKNIIIISFGDPTDTLLNPTDYHQYNVITVAINQSSNNNQTTEYPNLEEWHKKLGGSDSSYIISQHDGNNLIHVMEKAATKVIGNKTSTTLTVTPVLNFDLGNHFKVVENEDEESTITENNQYKLSVPDIMYSSNNQKNPDGTYTYKADPVSVSFKLKVQTDEIGSITFGNIEDVEYNNITYTQFNGTRVSKLIETPTFKVIAPVLDIDHGLYGGISNNNINIIPSLEKDDTLKEIVGTSIVNFAGMFTFQPYYKQFSLIIDPKLEIDKNNIKLYEIKGEGTSILLTPINDADMYIAKFSDENKILLNLYSKVEAGAKILVHYSIEAPDQQILNGDGIYTNYLQIDNERKPVQIRVIETEKEDNSEINLPYLF